MTTLAQKLDNQLLDPPTELLAKVMQAVKRQQQLARVRRNLAYCGAFFIISIVAVFPALLVLQQQAEKSGFWQYLTLIFLDFSVTVAHWPDYSLALLESLPVINLALSLTLILVTLVLLRVVVRNFQLLSKLTYKYSN